ncbi:hypothetical protein EYR36_006900 [Pleurotus pulmonarius]|nr:hypothetical protein EYR36_006900 [Pleurotus pulmonarius]
MSFCQCKSSVERSDLLMKSGIFPATLLQPNTGFTENVVSLFLTDSVTSKKSGYDFVKGLRLRTNGASLSAVDVPLIYKAFMRVIRVARTIKMKIRSGQAHGIDAFFPGRTPGSVVVHCMACPEPGFNMEEELDPVVDEELLHVESKFLSADGHFGLPRKKKVDDPDDIALTDGMAFFPKREEYETYIKQTKESEEKSTCANLSAANLQNKLKFKGYAVSGVVSVNCARHNMFQRGGMSDLDRGEKFAITDHSLKGALTNIPLPHRLVLTYDIACQYGINLHKRLAAHFKGDEHAKLRATAKRLQLLIPKLHLHGHIDECFYLFALGYTPGTGRTDGERIEGGWAEEKQAGGSTKEMNPGHRHDVLNDMQNFANWMRTINLGDLLTTAYVNAQKMSDEKRNSFLSLSLIVGQERVQEWSTLSTSPTKTKGSRGQRPNVESVYRFKQESLPSQSEIMSNMLADARKINEQQESLSTPVCVYLNEALKIETKQYIVHRNARRPDLTAADLNNLAKARSSLSERLNALRSMQQQLQPLTLPLIESQITQAPEPEMEQLFLPSHFTTTEREKYGLTPLADIERQLRKGQANDTVQLLRLDISTGQKLALFRKSRANALVGVQRTTRNAQWMKKQKQDLAIHKATYTRARIAMIKLGMPENDNDFPPLHDEDLATPNPIERPILGDGTRKTGWIWRAANVVDMPDTQKDDYEEDAKRVTWFRAKADMERWQEELEILGEEIRRTIRGLEKMASVWRGLATVKDITSGNEAYAKKKAHMFEVLAHRMKVDWSAPLPLVPTQAAHVTDGVFGSRDVSSEGLLENFSDDGLKKRIKAITISDTPLCVNAEVGFIPGPAQYSPAEPTKPQSRNLTPPELISQHILKVLDGADNLEELRILHNLTTVSIAMRFTSEIWHTLGALPLFLKNVASSVEVLHVGALNGLHSGAISLAMTKILCVLAMPNLRELATPLMVSAGSTRVFNALNSKHGSLTKLVLDLHAEDNPSNASLSSLRLPHLQALWLNFVSEAAVPGLWSGRYEFPELNELRIDGRHLGLEEVASMCRFFAQRTIAVLSLRVSVLDGALLSLLAASLPALRDLSLFAADLSKQHPDLTARAMAHVVDHFKADIEERNFQGWALKKTRGRNKRKVLGAKQSGGWEGTQSLTHSVYESQ